MCNIKILLHSIWFLNVGVSLSFSERGEKKGQRNDVSNDTPKDCDLSPTKNCDLSPIKHPKD